MNAKTIKKLLMRSRVKNLWGRRAYLTVRVPTKALVSTPRPSPVEFPGFKPSTLLEGHWEGPEESVIYISHLFSGTNPALRSKDGEPVYFPVLEHRSEYLDEDTGEFKVSESWSWWTGMKVQGDTREALTEAQVASYKAFREWFDALHTYDQNPLRDAFLGAGEQAKSMSFATDASGETLFLTYGVKWFYPARKLVFSSALAKAMKQAKSMGVPVRVVG